MEKKKGFFASWQEKVAFFDMTQKTTNNDFSHFSTDLLHKNHKNPKTLLSSFFFSFLVVGGPPLLLLLLPPRSSPPPPPRIVAAALSSLVVVVVVQLREY